MLVERFKEEYEFYESGYIVQTDQRLDCIILFDVLKHIERENFVVFFGNLVDLLKPNGVIVASFPNGNSPINRLNFNLDLTHRICI
jgi:2-polyprenyl-3-methyl-5-hydroxy-6-metoxy-1,4-benzoquinol methylase